jgi:hypothetical protein
MKQTLIIGAFAALMLSSCAPTSYQVFETASSDVKTNGSSYQYIGEDLAVDYNLWNESGNMRFKFYNNSDIPIYIDLDRSHLIVNGQSFDYYNDTETNTSNKNSISRPTYLASAIKTNQIEIAVKSKPKRLIEIPPHSFTSVGGLTITNGIIDCSIGKMKNGVAESKSFNTENSPLQFRNYVTYSYDPDFRNIRTIDNSFYAQKVLNLSSLALKGKTMKYKDCPDDSYSKIGYEMPYNKPQNIRVVMLKK